MRLARNANLNVQEGRWGSEYASSALALLAPWTCPRDAGANATVGMPFQAEEIRWGFSDAQHIIVQNAGHEDTLPNQQVQAAVARFLEGQDVGDARIALPAPKFRAAD